ncbi:hypothetical protein PoB_000398800 [Plakobranchus ocellatus]|uniref:Uncharacterized protein n=1 Tax=Plakobranchus ocellatus TaxID=259542 RepID=A0AAV3Y5M1_9GAST|nr:hypothetical protein PoB_000398800 [Plakobranchus ocellatus]
MFASVESRHRNNDFAKQCGAGREQPSGRQSQVTEKTEADWEPWVTARGGNQIRYCQRKRGQGAGDAARTRKRMVPADFRAVSLSTVSPTPPGPVDSTGIENLKSLSYSKGSII